jgi:phosphatidylinositol-3-phosphatase
MRIRTACAALALAAAGCSSAPQTGRAPHTPSPPKTSTSVKAASYSGSAPCGWRASSTYRHVIWIWMENRTYSSVLGSGSAAPRLSSYAGRCGLATQSYAVTHPSLPNYLAATSGSTGGVSSDCGPAQCPQRRASLFGQIQRAGRQWRSYAESMPHTCDLSISGRYAPKHNPAVYFTPVRSRCQTWDRPMGGSSGAFATALSHRTLPAFSFVTPDMCHDGHDCSTATADSWLGTWLGRITSSAAYRAADTAVFVTWDEGVGSDQHIATVVIAPTVPRGTRSASHFTHYSLLRTTEDLLGLSRLGAAARARSMRSAFHL